MCHVIKAWRRDHDNQREGEYIGFVLLWYKISCQVIIILLVEKKGGGVIMSLTWQRHSDGLSYHSSRRGLKIRKRKLGPSTKRKCAHFRHWMLFVHITNSLRPFGSYFCEPMKWMIQQVHLVSVKAERPNHPSRSHARQGGVSPVGGGVASQGGFLHDNDNDDTYTTP